MAEPRNRPFTCWETAFTTGPGGPNLQELLDIAFADTMSSDRLWPPQAGIDADASLFQSLINEIFPMGNFLCGHFLKYSKEQVANALTQSPDGRKLDLTKFELPLSDGKPQHLLSGNLYFVCHENHLAICQSQNLRASNLEKYLNDMFYTRCRQYLRDQRVRLKRALSRQKYNKLSGVRGIRITGPIDYRDEMEGLLADDDRLQPPARRITASRFLSGVSNLAGQDVEDYGDDFNGNYIR